MLPSFFGVMSPKKRSKKEGRQSAVPLFSTIQRSIPIPITSYSLIAAVERYLRREGVDRHSMVKNHSFFTKIAYSLRVITILVAGDDDFSFDLYQLTFGSKP
ncbi:hypothetical protein SEEN4900_01226 [Salmonella enterica subsp. enterica serovar Newport str. WA_14900]|nr:hypothetical protein SEEN4900_01226 [Salmonella enterica subsp. enterica serovar Newport str. WA_14900]